MYLPPEQCLSNQGTQFLNKDEPHIAQKVGGGRFCPSEQTDMRAVSEWGCRSWHALPGELSAFAAFLSALDTTVAWMRCEIFSKGLPAFPRFINGMYCRKWREHKQGMERTSSCTRRNKASPGDSSWHYEPSHVLLSKTLSNLTDLRLFELYRVFQPQLSMNG